MKPAIREDIRSRIAALPADVQAAKSQSACRRLLVQPVFERARVVMAYAATPGELDTRELLTATLRAGKRLVLPRIASGEGLMDAVEVADLKTELQPGRFGIAEPVGERAFPHEQIDLVVTPAVAYDRRGWRVGRGGGFYDRFLARPGLKAVACGLGFAEQLVDALPHGPHDRPVNMLVTDTEVLRFAGQRSKR